MFVKKCHIFFQYLEKRSMCQYIANSNTWRARSQSFPILRGMPLRASKILSYRVPKSRNPWKNRALRGPGTVSDAQKHIFTLKNAQKWRPRQNDVLNIWLLGAKRAQSSNILPILRELLDNIQYKYLESFKSIFLQTLSLGAVYPLWEHIDWCPNRHSAVEIAGREKLL